MFDIAFSELMIIGIVALVVIGPERLPKVARTVGGWLGKLNRYASQVKQDIDRDMQLEELRKLQSEMKESAQKYEILAREAEEGVSTAVKTEVNHLDKVMKAMASTDGGLTMTEYEKSQAEKRALENKASDTPEGGEMPIQTDDAKATHVTNEAARVEAKPESTEYQPTSLDDELIADKADDLGTNTAKVERGASAQTMGKDA